MAFSIAKPTFEHLVIKTDSWHYRYFLFIRSWYGLNKPPARTSLCPYFQTMLWFTIVAILISPFCISGWLILKAFRITYKLLDRAGCNKLIDWIDGSPVGEFSESASTKAIQDAPAPTTAFGAIICVLAER